jgi:hypothetical protein
MCLSHHLLPDTYCSSIEQFCAARDIADLYRAIIPIQWGEAIDNNPARTMIFFNDCMYFAHHLLTIGFQFKDKGHESMNKFMSFVDMVPFFRDIGESKFKQQLVTLLTLKLSLFKLPPKVTAKRDFASRASKVARL